MACFSLFFQTLYLLAVFLVGICNLLHVEAEIFDEDAISGGDSDITSALQQAWNQACNGTNNRTVLVPYGNFLLNFVNFTGPCKGYMTFQVNGNLTAPVGAFIGVDLWVLFNNVQCLSVTGTGTFDGLGETAWPKNDCKHNKTCKDLPASIQLANVTNASIQGITSLNSKFFHILISDSKSIDINGVKIQAPDNSPNTDGIHVAGSNGVKIRNSDIGTGDDCVSIVRGSKDVHIYNVNCGPGHGFSIGSIGKDANEGDVNGIIVENSTLTNTTNGLRIKTWAAPSYPSKIFNVTYSHITLNNVDNSIVINQHYCPNSQCGSMKGESKVKISDVKYLNISGSSSKQMAVALSCSSSNPCQKIVLSGLNITLRTGGQTKASCANVKGEFVGCISPTHCG